MYLRKDKQNLYGIHYRTLLKVPKRKEIRGEKYCIHE